MADKSDTDRFIDSDPIIESDDEPFLQPWDIPGYFKPPSPIEQVERRVRERTLREVSENVEKNKD